MKHLAIILAAALLSTAAHAQRDHYITTHEGQITLHGGRQCTSGPGNEAVFIFDKIQGGAYGCWIREGDTAVVTWKDLIGANRSHLKANYVQRIPLSK